MKHEKIIRCTYTALGRQMEKPEQTNRLGYMAETIRDRSTIAHVMVYWDGTDRWNRINAKYVRPAYYKP